MRKKKNGLLTGILVYLFPSSPAIYLHSSVNFRGPESNCCYPLPCVGEESQHVQHKKTTRLNQILSNLGRPVQATIFCRKYDTPLLIFDQIAITRHFSGWTPSVGRNVGRVAIFTPLFTSERRKETILITRRVHANRSAVSMASCAENGQKLLPLPPFHLLDTSIDREFIRYFIFCTDGLELGSHAEIHKGEMLL